jgi:hypothetical protein
MTASDTSTRYILPATAHLLANLAALWSVDPALARAIEQVEEGYPTEVSRSGEPTLQRPTPSARSVYLHSRYEPRGEAKKQVDRLPVADRITFSLQGLGLGYLLSEISDRAARDAIFCVFEPDLKLIRTALELHDFSTIIRDHRLLFFVEADKSQLFLRLMPYITQMSLGFEPVIHSPSFQVNPEFFDQMKIWIEEFTAYAKTCISTLVINGKRTSENITRNLAWYLATPSLSRLKDAYRGKPAVIVSAGPSLRKNKHLLTQVQSKACVIAVQTTFQPLLEMGVEPQFVTSLDYHDICTRFFEKLPKHVKTELVAEPKATNRIFDLNPGPVSLLGNDFADMMLREMKPQKERLPSGATVAHLAFYLAEHMGCDPIIFLGQDLGFSDGLCYTPGTSYEDVWRPELSRFCTVEMKQWEQIVRDRHILRKVPDFQGRPMYTEERLFTYLQQFERDFIRSKSRIIDATEGGVLKRGSTPMSFAEAIAQFCQREFDPTPPEHPGLDQSCMREAIASLRNRVEESLQIEEIGQQTLPLLEEIRDHVNDQQRVNLAITRIDAIRKKLIDVDHCYRLITSMTQSSELQRFQADARIAASKLEGIDLQRRQVQRDIDNVKAVMDASAEFRKTVCETIDMIQIRFGDEREKVAA